MDYLGYRHGVRAPSDDGKRNTPVALTAATSTERTTANCTRGNRYAFNARDENDRVCTAFGQALHDVPH